MQKLSPTRDSKKGKKMYSFFEIFQAPQQYLNLQQSKSHQNGLKMS